MMHSLTKSFSRRAIVMALFVAGLTQPLSVFAASASAPGTVTSWGDNKSFVPVPVALPPGVTASDIASGTNGNLAITNDGLYGWYGLGTDDTTLNTPTRLDFPLAVFQFKAISVGFSHSLALTNDGLYAWGAN